jgi:type II secretory pathway pseudopilin PulG
VAFTLVEVLLILIVLAILAAIVVPQYSQASTDARVSELRTSLHTIRAQLELYKIQHCGSYPSSAAFVEQMTLYTDVNGCAQAVKDAAHGLGPYLLSIPRNPFTGTNTVSADDNVTSAWYYDEAIGEFKSNCGDAVREGY